MRKYIESMLLLLLTLTTAVAAAEPRGRIALTFDDAPRGNGPVYSGPERTDRLIEALDAAGVEGVMFFVTTGNLEKAPRGAERLRAYVDAGHRLANHSHSHPWLWRSTVEDYIADLDLSIERLGDFDGTSPFYRFPFLDEGRSEKKRDVLRTALAARGLRNGYVTVDNYDWYMNALLGEAVKAGHDIDRTAWCAEYVAIMADGVIFYDRIARQTLGRSPDHVLLLHENDLAALCIGDLVYALQADGWTFISAETAFEDAIADRAPDTLFNNQGRVAALAHEAGRAPRSLIHESEDEGWLRARFTAAGLLASSGE